MLAPKSRRPTVRNLMDPAVPAPGVALDSGIPSPRSPLERDPRSPKGWRERDSVGAVGLGIVAALERTSSDEPLARLIVANSSRQPTKIAIPIKSQTCSHETAASHAARDHREIMLGKNGFFCASPPRFSGVSVFREADFLTYCHLCRKRLQGKDIYMYRGEKAFCSMECRYQQIVSDECQEKCASEASISISSSSYCNDRLFFTGITAP